jgi:hypothetical protein
VVGLGACSLKVNVQVTPENVKFDSFHATEAQYYSSDLGQGTPTWRPDLLYIGPYGVRECADDAVWYEMTGGPNRLAKIKEVAEARNLWNPAQGGELHQSRLISFVHMSDAQIRNENATILSPEESEFFDKYIGGLVHHRVQEIADRYIYMALVGTVNAYFEGAQNIDKPLFMIHTGDAVDAGLMDELYDFIAISDGLEVPWFNVVGNHDVLAFGTMIPGKETRLSAGSLSAKVTMDPRVKPADGHDLLPQELGSGRFICDWRNAGSGTGEIHRLFTRAHLKPDRQGGMIGNFTEQDPLYLRWGRTRMEMGHGFGLNLGPREGNYHLPVKRPDGGDRFQWKAENGKCLEFRVRMVGLQTSRIRDGGPEGVFDDDAMAVLAEALDEAERNKELVLVFGHHPLNKFVEGGRGEDLANTLHEHPNVVAYFSGHTHKHRITRHVDRDEVDKRFWEVVTGSILEYPQQARLVTLGYIGGGIGYLQTSVFGHTFQSDACQDSTACKRFGQIIEAGFRSASVDRENYGEKKRVRRQVRSQVEMGIDFPVVVGSGADTNAVLFFKLPDEYLSECTN